MSNMSKVGGASISGLQGSNCTEVLFGGCSFVVVAQIFIFAAFEFSVVWEGYCQWMFLGSKNEGCLLSFNCAVITVSHKPKNFC